jgi:hypothetical protein
MSNTKSLLSMTANTAGHELDEELYGFASLANIFESIVKQKTAQFGANAPQSDILPSFSEISRTHIIPTYGQFYRVAHLTQGITKYTTHSGNLTLGEDVNFVVGQGGDLLHTSVCKITLSALASPAKTAPTAGATNGGVIQLPSTAGLNTYTMVDKFGVAVASAATTLVNSCGYINYFGERLIEKAVFHCQEFPLQTYGYMDSVLKRKRFIAPAKLPGYCRLVGQEVRTEGFRESAYHTWTDNQSSVPAAYTTANQPTISHTSHALDSGYGQAGRQVVDIYNGLQTPKQSHPATTLWIPLNFGFCEDPKSAFPISATYNAEKKLTITLATVDKIAQQHDSLALKTVYDSFVSGDSGTTAFAKSTTYTQIANWAHGAPTAPAVSDMEIYANIIHYEPRIHRMYKFKQQKYLTRYFLHYSDQKTNTTCELTQLKLPCEYLFIGFQPAWNYKNGAIADVTALGNMHRFYDWQSFSKVYECTIPDSTSYSLKVWDGGLGTPALADATLTNTNLPIKYYVKKPVVSTVNIQVQGNDLFNTEAEAVYSSVQTQLQGGEYIYNVDEDFLYFFCFSLFPGAYNPSGSYNLTKSNKLNLTWTGDYISTNTPVDVHWWAKVINAVMISGGSGVNYHSN